MSPFKMSSQSRQRKQERTKRLRFENLEDRRLLAAVPIEPAFKLIPDDLAEFDNAGFAVAIDGDTAVVGSGYDEDKTGAAYVFVRHGREWVQEAKLTASDGEIGDRFGNGVAVSGDTILIGAPGVYDPNLGAVGEGGAYIFKRNKGSWTEDAILRSGKENDFFGSFVALDNNTALVSAIFDDRNGLLSGTAYAFGQRGNEWTMQADFAELVPDGTQFLDILGAWVAVSGNTALVTAQGADQGDGLFEGEAHFFTRQGQTWVHQVEVTASDGEPGDFFGFIADIDGDTAVITADGDDGYTGAAYVFQRKGNTWTEQQKLTASDGQPGDSFGTSAAVSGRNILVSNGNFGSLNGSTYLYTRGQGGEFTERGRFVADDTTDTDFFGSGIDVHGNWAITGAFRADVDGNVDSGAAYIFKINDVIAALDEAASELAFSAEIMFDLASPSIITGPAAKIAAFDAVLENEYRADRAANDESADEEYDVVEDGTLKLLAET